MHAVGRKALTAGPVTADMRHAVLIQTVHGVRAQEVQFADSVITAGEPAMSVAEPERKFARHVPVELPVVRIRGMQ